MQRNNASHFFFSLALHLVVVLALMVSLSFSALTPVMQNADKNTEVINAMVMSEMPSPEPIKKVMPTPIVKPAIPQPPKPVEKVVPVPVKNQAIVIPDKKAAKLRQEKIAQDLLADLQKHTKVEKKVHRKVVVSAFANDMKFLSEKPKQHVSQEQQQISGARQQQIRGEVDKYSAMIVQLISSHWFVPPNVDKHLYAKLLVRVAPGGVVLSVDLVKSSGNDSLDRSARAAIFKSSPLPVPKDSDAFEPFRQIMLKATPQSVLMSG